MNIFREWWQRNFSDPQVVALVCVLVVALLVVIFFGSLLAPVFAAAIIAYLLESPVRWLERVHLPRWLAAALLTVGLLCGILVVLFTLIPLLTHQASQIFQDAPSIIASIQAWMLDLPSKYPSLVTTDQVNRVLASATQDIGQIRQFVFSRSLVVGIGLLYVAVYLVLVPLLVFFFLRDKSRLLAWFSRLVPRNRRLLHSVWYEVDIQMANYVRGKALEIMIVWAIGYGVFTLMGLHYAVLLSALFGLSTVVPFVGALATTIPVAAVAFSQWGLHEHTAYLLVVWGLLNALDGNVLQPVLFSETVHIHPVAIIVAVLFFGGIWGLWGVFFAIPLATVVNAVLNAWQKAPGHARSEVDDSGRVDAGAG